MKLKRCEQGFFESKRGSAQYEADRRGGKKYYEPKNDIMYRFCMILIDHTIACTR